jgi:hypothetical protein
VAASKTKYRRRRKITARIIITSQAMSEDKNIITADIIWGVGSRPPGSNTFSSPADSHDAINQIVGFLKM